MIKGTDSSCRRAFYKGVIELKHGSHGTMLLIDVINNRGKDDALSDIDDNNPDAHTIDVIQTLNDLAKFDKIKDIIAMNSKYDSCATCLKLCLTS